MRVDEERRKMDPVVTSRSGRSSTFTCRSMNASPTTSGAEQHFLLTLCSIPHNHDDFKKLRGAKARIGPLRMPRQHLYEGLCNFLFTILTQTPHRPLTNGRRSIPPHHKPHPPKRTPHDLFNRFLRHRSLPRRRTTRPTHNLRLERPQNHLILLHTPSPQIPKLRLERV